MKFIASVLSIIALGFGLLGCPSGGGGGGSTPPFAISTTTADFGVVGNDYTSTLATTGGTAPFTWTLFDGTLPTGSPMPTLALDANTGVVSGTPDAVGNFTATFIVTDSTGQTAIGTVLFAIHTRTDLLSTDNSVPPVPGNGLSITPSISDDGRFVAFASLASNLSSGGVGSQIYVHDWQTNQTSLVSRSRATSSPTGANGPSTTPVISGDGRFVAFVSDATDLLPAGSPAVTGTQIYVHDRQLDMTSLVSRDNSGNAASGGSIVEAPSINGDGRFITFATDANFGATGKQIYLRDTQGSGQTILISMNNVPTPGDGNSTSPSISSDGCFVAFASEATNLGTPANQVHIRGPLAIAGCGGTEQTLLVSQDGGNPGSVGSINDQPSVNGNGRFVAFRSTATNFGATGTQIYIHDTQAGQTILISKDNSTPPVAGNNPSDTPSISDDGCFVAFASTAANLGPAANQIYARGPLAFSGCTGTEQISLVSRDDAGNPANSGAGTTVSPSVNGNGQFIAFASSATNLISPPTGNSQIYVRAMP